MYSSEISLKSLLFGKYSRSRPLVFSLVPRFHGVWGGGKKNFTSSSWALTFLNWTNSRPRSGVMECSVCPCMILTIVLLTGSTFWLEALPAKVYRVLRSTTVTRQALPFFPITVSASKWPFRERFFAPGDRFDISVHLGNLPLLSSCPFLWRFLPWWRSLRTILCF